MIKTRKINYVTFLSAFCLFFALALPFKVNAWVENAGVYTCTTGECEQFCDTASACAGATFIATHASTNAKVVCSDTSACEGATFYLASLDQSIFCSATDACKNTTIRVGVPDSISVADANGMADSVPVGFEQSDFFGPVAEFSINCAVAGACEGMDVFSYYEVAQQNLNCGENANTCNNMSLELLALEGDMGIACVGASSCTSNISLTVNAENTSCSGNDIEDGGNSCGNVTFNAGAVPNPDVDDDGVLDANDLCPTGVSNGAGGPRDADADGDGCNESVDAGFNEDLDTDGDGVDDVLDGLTLEWDGPAIFGDFFDESNWLDNDEETAANVINPDQVIGREIVMQNVALTLPDSNIFLGEGNSLTLTDVRLNSGFDTTFHPVSVGGGGSASITLNGNSRMEFGLAWDIAFDLVGPTSRIISINSNSDTNDGVLGRGTTVNFEGGQSFVELELIDPVSAQTWVSKFTVDSVAAVLDSNLLIISNGSGGSFIQPDFDADGVGGFDDRCPTLGGVTSDFDSDGCDDATQDTDDDNDGIEDVEDACLTPEGASDLDRDGCEDAVDTDDDGDGVLDSADSCPASPQGLISFVDFDGDGCEDTKEDGDDDNDGVPDGSDRCMTEDLNLSSDFDEDGCDDADEDLDDDNDGTPDVSDDFPLDPSRSTKKPKAKDGSLFFGSLFLLSLLSFRRKQLVAMKK